MIGPEMPPTVELPAVVPTSNAVPEPEREETVAIPTSLAPPEIGPETNLPLPRFVSLKTDEGNVRRGPSLSHRIDWVFVRRGMPLQVTAEYGHWRRVIDREGIGGWVHYALISGNRSVIVDEDMLPLLRRPDADAPVAAQLEAGVIARLDECTIDWCRIAAGGYRGWAPKTALWGVEPDEIRD
ncbi:SH3 domain-containing protein [Alexandriicola marinus]|uniref:SH3 domain-containing protein n=1 Tax=Alexandriicola marinus TaxID=2081710 RepID=UPI003B84B5DC